MYVPTISIVVEYFERRRALAFGLGVSGVGVGTLIFPPIVEYLEETYGWRGAIMLLGAITLNSLVCSSFFRPSNMKKKNKTKCNCSELFNYHILADHNYIILCVNQILFAITVSTVHVHLPHFAVEQGISRANSTLLVSIMGLCNLIGRLACGGISSIPKVDSILFYSICCMILGILTMLCGLYDSLWSLMLFAGLFGMFNASWGVHTAEITVQLLEPSLLPSAYGYILLCDGIGFVAGAPIAGKLHIIFKELFLIYNN